MFFFSNISPLTFWDIWDRSFAPPAYAWTCPYSGYRQSSPGETDSLASSDVVHVQKWHVSRIFNEKTVDPPILIRKNVFSSKLLPGGLLPSRIYQIVLDDLQSRSWIIWGSGERGDCTKHFGFTTARDGQNPWESYVLDLLGWCCPCHALGKLWEWCFV